MPKVFVSFFKSPFLQDVEGHLLKYVYSGKPISITDENGHSRELTNEEMEELHNFFANVYKNNPNMDLIKPNKPSPTEMVILQKKKDDDFKREVERTLFKSIYPSEWQVGVLIKDLDLLLNWKDKRQRAIVSVYEPYIVRALNSLQERKKRIDKKIGWPSQREY